MWLIYEPATNKIICWAAEGQNAIYPVPEPGQIETTLDCTVEEFEQACRESSGDWTSDGVGPNFLHDTVTEATNSGKTTKKGKKIGHKAVECEHPDEVTWRDKTLTERIEEKRKVKGKKMSDPITIEELKEIENEV